eukprot:GFUD01033718.1.p1 GENE.GFUD01033718.1~~GFUD01033718.1.p1  ORF type:complete len:563 (-),score=165.78 GFUD01033718.1:500-2188(-)
MPLHNRSALIIPTRSFDGQKPGTSGLRKSVKVFQQPNYTENFVQASLWALEKDLPGATLVVGGDGRFYMDTCTDIIIKVAAANKVSKLIVGKGGFLSTPAVSNLIRKHKTTGGFILTASHNPGGPNADFGLKFNCANGGPAPDAFTNKIFENTKTINKYYMCPDLQCDFNTIGTYEFMIEGNPFTVEVIDPTEDYTELMKTIFDFAQIKQMIKEKNFKILINSLHGATGPYAEKIFLEELGCEKSSCIKTNVLPDFGGGHPDPNLTYAVDLVNEMAKGEHGFGAAFDGDGDRNMILGQNAFFVTPCDSLAVLANNLEHIPWFKAKGGKGGVARSMPTSGAVDRVAAKKGLECFDTPTGWKYFGNLLDAGRIVLCGEESFGTGSDHIREKDGLWAALAWLQVLAVKGCSVEQLLTEHWKEYGRNFFTRYDYEGCESAPCEKMMDNLQAYVEDNNNIGKEYSAMGSSFAVSGADNFSYTDPIDGSKASKQGIRIMFSDGSRLVFRLSGTGSSGATVRMYVDSYCNDPAMMLKSSQEMLKPAVEVGLVISQLRELTGRQEPTVIT